MGKTGLVYDPRYLDHDMGPGHPESPQRLRAIMQRLEESGVSAQLARIEPRKAEDEWITLVHRPAYLEALAQHAPASGRVPLDADTAMSPGSLTAAYLAAGAALAGADAIMAGRMEHVFCAVRPPATMPKPAEPWDSASSTMWRLLPATSSVGMGSRRS